MARLQDALLGVMTEAPHGVGRGEEMDREVKALSDSRSQRQDEVVQESRAASGWSCVHVQKAKQRKPLTGEEAEVTVTPTACRNDE